MIDPKGGIFTCFGGCPPKEGKDHLTGDVIDLHQRAFNLASLSAAKQSLEQLDAGKLKAMPIPLFVTPAFEPKSKVDEELVSKVLMEDLGEPTISPNGATAADFAKLLLGRFKPEDKPIVFVNQKWPIIGVAARARLRQRPDELQYLCCSTAVRAIRNKNGGNAGTRQMTNMKERIFLAVRVR